MRSLGLVWIKTRHQPLDVGVSHLLSLGGAGGRLRLERLEATPADHTAGRKKLVARRRSRIADADYGYFSVTVSASSAYISHGILDPKYDAGRDAASSTITTEGALDTPVIPMSGPRSFARMR